MNYRHPAIAWLALLHMTFSRQDSLLELPFTEFPQADTQPARHFAEHLLGLMVDSGDSDLVKVFSEDAIRNYREARADDLSLLELIAKAMWAHCKGVAPEIAVDLARQSLPLADQPSDSEFGQMILHNEEEIIEEARRRANMEARLDDYIAANQAIGG